MTFYIKIKVDTIEAIFNFTNGPVVSGEVWICPGEFYEQKPSLITGMNEINSKSSNLKILKTDLLEWAGEIMSSKFKNCLVLYIMHAEYNKVMILMFPLTNEKLILKTYTWKVLSTSH